MPRKTSAAYQRRIQRYSTNIASVIILCTVLGITVHASWNALVQPGDPLTASSWNAVTQEITRLGDEIAGLGTAASTDSTAYATAAQGNTADSALQPDNIGTDIQAYSSVLTALATVTPAADRLPYFSGEDTASHTTLTSYARSLLTAIDSSTARSTLGLGSLATQSAVGNSDIADGIITFNKMATNLCTEGQAMQLNASNQWVCGEAIKARYHADCTAGEAGLIRFDSEDQTFSGCDGNQWLTFAPPAPAFTCGSSTVTHEGYTYSTVQIGTQCWLGENIKHGTMLASGSTMPSNNGTVQKWCYNNDPALCESEGGLYHWDEAMNYSTTEGAQGICPAGWHIPRDSEWHTLESHLATGSCNASRNNSWDCDPAGTALKVGGNLGFNAVMTGHRHYTAYDYRNRGTNAHLWSSSGSGSSAWDRYLHSSNSTIYRVLNSKAYGFPVRCVQD